MAQSNRPVPMARKRNKYPDEDFKKSKTATHINKTVNSSTYTPFELTDIFNLENTTMSDKTNANVVEKEVVNAPVSEMENTTMTNAPELAMTPEMQEMVVAMLNGLKDKYPEIPDNLEEVVKAVAAGKAGQVEKEPEVKEKVKPHVTEAMLKCADKLSGYLHRASKADDEVAYFTDLARYINRNEANFTGEDKEFYSVLKDFCELKLSIFKGEVDVSELEKLTGPIDENIKKNVERIKQEEKGMKEIAKETQIANHGNAISGNVVAAVVGGVAGAATSLAWDFVFGTDQTTSDMLIDAGVSAGIGAATGYGVALLADMEYSNACSSSALGAAAGIAASAAYRSTMELFSDADDLIAELPELEE